jgi:predicted NAD/FAD-dependent oxidoreductase
LRRGYGEVHARLGRYLEARGGVVRRRALCDAVELEGARAAGVCYTQRAQTRDEIREGRPAVVGRTSADAVVLAVPWSVVPGLLPPELQAAEPFAGLSRLRGSPIVSIEMWLDRVVVDRVMVGLRGCDVEWVFDKGRLFGRASAPQHLAFIVSAAYRCAPRPNAELVAAAEAALRRFFPAMSGASVVRSLVMREAEATFASDPASEPLRPAPRMPVPGLFLAGDWTRTGLPATIEGAVRSGLAAAREVEGRG